MTMIRGGGGNRRHLHYSTQTLQEEDDDNTKKMMMKNWRKGYTGIIPHKLCKKKLMTVHVGVWLRKLCNDLQVTSNVHLTMDRL